MGDLGLPDGAAPGRRSRAHRRRASPSAPPVWRARREIKAVRHMFQLRHLETLGWVQEVGVELVRPERVEFRIALAGGQVVGAADGGAGRRRHLAQLDDDPSAERRPLLGSGAMPNSREARAGFAGLPASVEAKALVGRKPCRRGSTGLLQVFFRELWGIVFNDRWRLGLRFLAAHRCELVEQIGIANVNRSQFNADGRDRRVQLRYGRRRRIQTILQMRVDDDRRPFSTASAAINSCCSCTRLPCCAFSSFSSSS